MLSNKMTVSREKVQQIGEELRPIAEAALSRRPLPDNAEGVVVNALSTLETEGNQEQRNLALHYRSGLQNPRGAGDVAVTLRHLIQNNSRSVYGLTSGAGRKQRTRKARRGRSVRKSRRSRR